ncbi:CG14174 [Drosophila busckii]|uniref:CG14174 n=1 Tax=Drosophila busckii TaxID=30019 RepID=A0A0M4F0E6_DROBS|nr:uncharacterized protein LOC108599388 [Drosophila busckii]ALC44220.1 CG14174 [Drosophila busckii]
MANFCLWNEFELKKPPLVTIQVSDTGFAKHVFVVINRYLQQLSGADFVEFEQTAALIGRLMARRKNSFRGFPGFRAVCKLNAALCRLLRLDLTRELQHFRGALPDVCDNDMAGEMPTRSSFEYVLVRLLSFYHLQERIRNCCLAAARYFGQMLRGNFFMEFLTVLIAAIAKIHKFSALQANNCATLYNKLLPQRARFPQVEKHQFLPENCKLPTQLAQIKVITPTKEITTETPITLQTSTVVTKVDKAKRKAKEDVGTVVERKPPAAAEKPAFEINTLVTLCDVKHFIQSESKARKNSPDSCITKSLKNHEWLAAQTLFERKVKAREGDKALNIFRKFIASKI